MRDQLHETPDMIINPYRFGTAAAGISEPLHWWDFDNTTTGLDDQGTGSWARLTNAGTSATSGTGPNGQNVLLFGTEDWINRSAVAWDGSNTQKLSCSLWVKSSAISSSGGWLMSWRGGGGNVADSAIFNDTSDFGSFRIYDDAAANNGVGNVMDSIVPASEWTHLVGVMDGGAMSLYRDGQLVDSSTFAGFTDIDDSAAANFAFGYVGLASPPSLSTAFEGEIMSPAIWDVALTQAEIDHLYNSGNGRQYGDLTII